jgi:hypothetical protein
MPPIPRAASNARVTIGFPFGARPQRRGSAKTRGSAERLSRPGGWAQWINKHSAEGLRCNGMPNGLWPTGARTVSAPGNASLAAAERLRWAQATMNRGRTTDDPAPRQTTAFVRPLAVDVSLGPAICTDRGFLREAAVITMLAAIGLKPWKSAPSSRSAKPWLLSASIVRKAFRVEM